MSDTINLSTQKISACPTLAELTNYSKFFTVSHKSGPWSLTRLLKKTNNNEFWGKIFLMQLKTEKKIYIFPLLLHKKPTKF